MHRWPGNVVHFFYVVLVTILCIWVHLFGRIGTLFIWPKQRRLRALGSLRAWTLRQAMMTLGPSLIKIGQVMSTRPDLFSPNFIAQLRRLQDRLPPVGFMDMVKAMSMGGADDTNDRLLMSFA